MNPLLATAEIQSFLDHFPNKSRRRGRHYFADGAVVEVVCLVPDRQFGAVVSGSQDYEVVFDYDAEARRWLAECTCPMSEDCKHAYAAMLALQANASKLAAPLPPASAKPGVKKKAKAKATILRLREEPQPPASALSTALTQALGRKLNRSEVDYVQRVQWVYQQASTGYSMTAETLRHLAAGIQSFSWERLTLWPVFPRDDWQLWLFCAWELRRRGLGIPEFMQAVTDLSMIEPAMKAWEREKEIAFWQANLAQSSLSFAPEAEPTDFRLMILPKEARIQWKNSFEEKFKDLKQKHLQAISEEYRTGSLAVAPEAMPLWLAVYNPYDFHTACNFRFDRTETATMLGHVLRVSGLAERIVTTEGLPLARPAETLRYQLQAARDESEDYAMELLLSDGSPIPPILAALPGRPALYLTERAVFEGPPPHGFGVREPLRIPAPALECSEGVNFLQGLNLDLPPRIAERTRRVNFVVSLFCELKPTYQGSDTDAVSIRVTSQLEGGETEHCTSGGWHSPRDYNGHKPKKKAKADNNGYIPLVDRSAQRYFPSLLQALGAKWDDYQERWCVRLTKKFPEVFVPWLESLPAEVEVHLDRELATLRDGAVS